MKSVQQQLNEARAELQSADESFRYYARIEGRLSRGEAATKQALDKQIKALRRKIAKLEKRLEGPRDASFVPRHNAGRRRNHHLRPGDRVRMRGGFGKALGVGVIRRAYAPDSYRVEWSDGTVHPSVDGRLLVAVSEAFEARRNPQIASGIRTPTMRDLSRIYSASDPAVERAARPVLTTIKRELGGTVKVAPHGHPYTVPLDKAGFPMRGGQAYRDVLAPGGKPRFGVRQLTAAYVVARRAGANIVLTDALEAGIGREPVGGYKRNTAKRLTRAEFERRYWRGGANTVPAMTRREFYSDYLESGQSFAAYQRSTSVPEDEYWLGKARPVGPLKNPEFFRDYAEARAAAQAKADRLGLDAASRATREYGRKGFAVHLASRNDSDYALAEIVRPAAGREWKRNPRAKVRPTTALSRERKAEEQRVVESLFRPGGTRDTAYLRALEAKIARRKNPPKLSAEQARVIAMLASSGGLIERIAGGFWSPPGTALRPGYQGTMVPSWSTTAHTIKAMEARGWLERAHVYPEAWRDTRRLTAAGYAAGAGHG